MTLPEMLADLPYACDIGVKRDAKGYQTSWSGYKLHIDAADGAIPVSCLLTLGVAARQPSRHPAGDPDGGASPQPV